MNEIGRGKQTETRKRKTERLKATSYIASWNAQGNMTSRLDLETFNEDMKGRKISICAIQETRNNNSTEIDATDPDEQRSREAEAQLRRITEAREERGRDIQAANRETNHS